MDADRQCEMTGLFSPTLHNLPSVRSLTTPCAINFTDSLKDKHGVGN